MKVIYAKYNRERLPKFQTETAIVEAGSKTVIRKRSLNSVGVPHILSMGYNYDLLKKEYLNKPLKIASVSIKDSQAFFEYVEGQTVNQTMINSCISNDKSSFFAILKRYKDLINELSTENNGTFLNKPEFKRVFGEVGNAKYGVYSLAIANIDLNFDNIIINSSDELVMIDYEWVFDFEIPVSFLYYRTINEFYKKNSEILNNFVDENELFTFFDVDLSLLPEFQKWEVKFQEYVFGQAYLYRINQSYEQPIYKYNDIIADYNKLKEEVKSQNDRIEELSKWGLSQDKEIAARNNTIVEQNSRIEELSKWGLSLDGDIAEKNNAIDKLNDEIAKLKADIHEMTTNRDSADEIIRLIQEEFGDLDKNDINETANKLKETRNELLNNSQTILNLQGHIELLLDQERILNNIYASKGWRLLQALYRIEGKILPEKSSRRRFFKIIYKTIRYLKKIIKYTNPANIGKFISSIKEQGFSTAFKKIFNYIEMRKVIETPPLQIFEAKGEYNKITFPKVDKPDVSIIIPVYNQWDYTYSCLQSIYSNTDGIKYEVIIADDVSSDETINIKNYIENIEVLRNKKNKGFLLNCNNASKHAKGKYILFLNNDTNVQKDWLKYLLDLIQSDSKIGMVGSKFVYSDGRLQEAGGIIWNDASGWNYGRLDDPEKPEYNYVKEVDYISGAGILIRTDLWKKIGGFDERYVPAYYEDADLAFEVRKHGYKVVLQPKSVIVHFEGISNGTDTSSGIKSYQVINKEKFVEKWKDVLQKEQFDNAQNVFCARDRSRDKKAILVIDHYVPNYDKDAGSRTMYQYLKLFVDMGLNVKFLGANFFPHQPYTSQLENEGIEILYGPYMYKNYEEWLKNNSKNFSFIYLLRPHIAEDFIDIVKKYSDAKIIYNGTDFHYIREARQYRIDKNISTLENARLMRVKEFELFRKSDIVFTISNYEKWILSKKMPDKKVVIIPTYIYESAFPIGKNRNYDKRSDISFIGGFGHAPNVDGIVWFVKNIFPQILLEKPDIRLNIIGSNPTDEIIDMASKNINVTGYIEDDILEEYYSKSRVVIAPLRFGAGVKGKIIEAIAHGLPVVTTSIGAEGILDADKIIDVADDEEGFAKKVIALYDSFNEWTIKRDLQIEYSKKYLSTDYAKNILKDVIN